MRVAGPHRARVAILIGCSTCETTSLCAVDGLSTLDVYVALPVDARGDDFPSG